MALFRLAIVLLLLPLNMAATHIVGGEIYYDYQGGNNYQITLKVYRDCINGQASFDNPARVCIYDVTGAIVDTLDMPFTGSAVVPPTINNTCFATPSGICVDYTIYTATVNLPLKAGGYYLVYQRCCRNNTIFNINQPGNTGSSYQEHIPGPEEVAINSSPRFNVYPPIYVCSFTDINLDHPAVDPDGDSLVYDFCSPYTGLDPCCPILLPISPNLGSSGCVSPPTGNCPTVGNPPPYMYVNYISPYSGSYPLSSNPAMQINPNTGHISGVPNITGQWVVGVCVREYRNGVLIGTHLRDFQFNVVPCPNLIVSAIQQQSQPCNGLTVQFTNLSTGGVSYSWNFGDPTTLSDTSNLQNPTYAYPDTGAYTITLINHGPNPSCNDTSTQVFYVYPLLQPAITIPPPQCIVGNSFSFAAGGQFAPYSTFSWNFSSWATPGTSTQQNPGGISYNQYGNFPVTLTVTQKNCVKTVIDTVTVYPNTQAQFQLDSAKGCQPLAVTFTNTSVYGAGESYVWYFGDGDTSSLENPTHVYTDTGTFNVTLVVTTTLGCVGSGTVSMNGLINVLPGPQAGFVANPTHTNIYNPLILFTDTSQGVINQTVDMGDGTILSSVPPDYTYGGYGTFVVTQIAISTNGCSDTARQTIVIDPDYTFYIPNTFTPNGDIHNEVFKPVSFGIYDYTMVIYDRWGVEIMETHDPEKGWDGKYRGQKCPEDVYVYKIEFTPLTDPYPRKLSGVIRLVR